MRRSAALLAAQLLFLFPAILRAQLGAATTQPADAGGERAAVPVRVVVLFSSGVGYFQHSGSVFGDASTQLNFKSGQINDILKSLILQDRGGGTVAAVTYPSQDPVERTLKSFQVDITANPSLADLLTQLRGAKVSAVVQGQPVSGIVLGVEKRQVPAGDKGPVDENFLTLLSGANVKVVPLADVRELQLDDPALQGELEKALAALAASRDQDKKPVTVAFRGKGKRDVAIGYVVETPVWKTSYRLLLGDARKAGEAAPATQPSDAQGLDNKGADGKGPEAKDGVKAGGMGPLPGKGTIQGWAIVENQTDNDWEDIQLSLVSGRPISFVQDLYRPLYVPRPVVRPELFASLSPQTYEGGMGEEKGAVAFGGGGAPPPGAPMATNAPPASAGRLMQMAKALPESGGESVEAIDAASSVSSVASANKLGELFQYTIRDPVTLARQKSAMIPIIEDPIEIERVSIYNPRVLPRNPLNGARVKNTTGKHLLAGPMTVLDSGSYAGDARIDDVPPGQERLVSFGVDLETLVSAVDNHTDQSFVSGQIVKGVLMLTYKDVMTQVYDAENKGDHDRVLIVEHAVHAGWTLTDTPAPAEKTDAVYRFKDTLAAGARKKLTVKEEQTRLQQIEILPGDVGTLEIYSRNGAIPARVRDALVKAAGMKRAVAETRRRIAEDDKKINSIVADQRRINETLKTIGQNTELYGRLMKKLDDQETQLEKLRAETDEMTKQADAQQKELENYLAGLNEE